MGLEGYDCAECEDNMISFDNPASLEQNDSLEYIENLAQRFGDEDFYLCLQCMQGLDPQRDGYSCKICGQIICSLHYSSGPQCIAKHLCSHSEDAMTHSEDEDEGEDYSDSSSITSDNYRPPIISAHFPNFMRK